MRFLIVGLGCLLAISSVCSAQECANGQCNISQITSQRINIADYNLAPGEILVAVNGVPVNHQQQVANRPIVNAVRAIVNGISSRIVNRDPVAYDHALREAQLLASRRAVGHPLGVAPGCRYAGTGTSFSPESPNHCYKEMPESRLVARAVVAGPDGRYYWSAHYR